MLYQRETRAELESRHWRVTQDQTGRLIAYHRLYPGGVEAFSPLGSQPDGPWMMAQFVITFQPQSTTHTNCAANIAGTLHFKPNLTSSGKIPTGPFPMNSPENTKEVESILTKAEKRLAAKHPEYRPI